MRGERIPFFRSSFLRSLWPRTMDTRKLNSYLFAAQIQIPIPNKYLGTGYSTFVFCRNNGSLMEHRDKVLSFPQYCSGVPFYVSHIAPMSKQIWKSNYIPTDFWYVLGSLNSLNIWYKHIKVILNGSIMIYEQILIF